MSDTGFKISDQKGFHVTFENGWTVSVQFGRGNYCENYGFEGENPSDPSSAYRGPVPHSRDAEVAAWSPDGAWFPIAEDDDVIGNQTPAQVLAIMNKVAAQ